MLLDAHYWPVLCVTKSDLNGLSMCCKVRSDTLISKILEDHSVVAATMDCESFYAGI